MNLKAFIIFGLSAFVLADEHTHKTLEDLRKATGTFHERFARWDGSYLGAVPVLHHSRSLRNTLHSAMSPENKQKAALAPRNLENEPETMAVARHLAREIGEAVDTAIKMKPMMEAIPIAGRRMGMMVFRSLHEASGNLGKEFSPRASVAYQEEAAAIAAEIDGHFRRGLAAFDGADQ